MFSNTISTIFVDWFSKFQFSGTVNSGDSSDVYKLVDLDNPFFRHRGGRDLVVKVFHDSYFDPAVYEHNFAMGLRPCPTLRVPLFNDQMHLSAVQLHFSQDVDYNRAQANILVFDAIDGYDLRDLLVKHPAKGQLNPNPEAFRFLTDNFRLAFDMLEALAVVQEKDRQHNDVTYENIMVLELPRRAKQEHKVSTINKF